MIRRHKVVAILAGLVGLLLAAVVGFGVYLNAQLGDIARFDSRLQPQQRAPQPEGTAAEARNILLLGTDRGNGASIQAELADGDWSPGAFRSDTIMVVHIPAEHDRAYLVSLPRDSYVAIPGHGRQKINAAFSYGGPDLAVRTVENLTGIYIDHITMIDWAGFKDLTRALGGVEVTVADTFTDTRNDRTWRKGTYNLQGTKALQYVRTRYGLAEGDLDRIKRQQNFLRAVMAKTISRNTLANPIKLTNLLGAITDATTVDSAFTPAEMRRIALQLRDLGPSDVEFLTTPIRGYATRGDAGDVVLLQRKETRALWRSIRNDNIDNYLTTYGGETLPEADQIR
ncbi:MAG: LCP family protein [Stackebrandtia sp.]